MVLIHLGKTTFSSNACEVMTFSKSITCSENAFAHSSLPNRDTIYFLGQNKNNVVTDQETMLWEQI